MEGPKVLLEGVPLKAALCQGEGKDWLIEGFLQQLETQEGLR